LEASDDRQEVQGILRRYADKSFSYADALSFIIIERLGLRAALSFDVHFRQYGIPMLPP
jgi:predicted nucleic acid-binding protein